MANIFERVLKYLKCPQFESRPESLRRGNLEATISSKQISSNPPGADEGLPSDYAENCRFELNLEQLKSALASRRCPEGVEFQRKGRNPLVSTTFVSGDWDVGVTLDSSALEITLDYRPIGSLMNVVPLNKYNAVLEDSGGIKIRAKFIDEDDLNKICMRASLFDQPRYKFYLEKI